MTYLQTINLEKEVERLSGVRLVSIAPDGPSRFTIAHDDRNSYFNALIGPYTDAAAHHPRDLRLFVNYREFDGTITFDLVVQDADDDAFLNNNAEGLPEKYRGYHWIRPDLTVYPS